MSLINIPLGPLDIQTDMVPRPPLGDPGGPIGDASLSYGGSLYSPSQAFRFTFQQDGNVVLQVIDDSALPNVVWVPIWSTQTRFPNFPPGTVRMQVDGNLVVYDNNANPAFASNTSGNPGAFLRMQDDGNLVVYAGNVAIWASKTNARAAGA